MAEKLLLALMATCTVWMVRVTGDCGKPPTLENGFLREQFIFHNSFHVGDKVSYGCYQGYVFKEGGSRSITCAEDSTWSPFRVECEPRNCGNPGEILNGYYKTTGTTLGNQVTFSCGVGYRMVGRAHRVCTAVGWDGQVPTCQSIRCENLPSIPNGQVPTPLYGDHWEYGMIAKYSCIGDYSLVGADELTCTAIGKWNNDPPSCKAVRCHRTELIANGRIIAGFGPTYRYRETIIYACLEGYEMIGNNVIECGENNVFVPPPPTCKTRTCDDPPELEHGSPLERFLSKNSFDVGSRVIYRCEKGYILKQKRLKYVTCQHDLTWTRLQTICEPRHCGNPGEIWDGYFRAPDDSLGSKAVFYCNKGYGIVGRDHRICTPDGWDGQVPTCQSATCAALPLISKGRTPSPPNGDHWEHGMIAEFSCQNGYSLIGAETLACTVNGEWDKDPPTCKVVRCIRPEPIVNGRIIKGFGPTYRYQETITYSCNNGFEMDGNSVIECSENNIFVPPPPTCRPPIRCKDLPRTTYGRTPTPPDGGHWKQGMIATYACFFGYSLIGANILVCSETGMWDKDPPTCKVVNCGNPKEILNGYYKTTGRTIGRKAIFYCNKGYRIVGRNFQSCTMNGWFGQVQKCELIGCQSPDPLANGHIVRGFRLIYEHRETITYSCNEGYEMYGSNVIECSENHTFTPPPPTCRLPLNCGDPGEILNGCYKTAGYNVTFYCDIGYKMVGRDYLQCTAEGWDGEVPSCEPITCGNPGAIANGYYKAPNWTVGNNVTFYCDVGYNIVGRDYRRCTAEGWDGEVPSCERINCGNPGEILNGYYTAPNQTVGNKVTFYCDFGYKMVGRDYRQCTAEGWDGEVPSCEPITCGNPGAIANGYYKAPNWTVGSNVTFYCDVGYNIVGRDYRRCTAEGWDGEVPSCEWINCGNPGEILNGYYTAPNQTIGNKVTFYCDIGYKMVGRDYRQCTAEGWDGEVPSCEPITCGNPGAIANGYYKAPNWTVGSNVTFYCDVGYNIVGRDYRRCTAEGWDGEVPSCERINCGNPGEILNGYYTAPNQTVGNKVTFYCDIGYKMVGRDYRQCTTEGWDGEVPSCETITCGNPGAIANGYYKAPNWTVGSNVTFYCDVGYNIVGRDYRRCTAEGWDGEVPSCEWINCGNLGDILNGYYTAPNQTVGNKVVFYCEIGYKMVGRDYRQCTAEGWDGEVPSCEPITCGNPGAIANGYYKAPNWTIGSNITFYCDVGYNIVGRDYWRCTAEGWDGEVPSCESINCGELGEILNGYYTPSNQTVGNKVTFYCNIGYKMVGRDYLQCTNEGWDGKVPFCESITCGNPGAIANGYYKAPNWTVGSNATFYCAVGYNIVGRDYRRCTAEGWEGEVPSCEQLYCGYPGEILNGYYTPSNQTLGNKVNFYCDIGYKMVGRDYRQCTAEGWDGEVPACERVAITCGNPGEILNGYYKAPNKAVGNKVTFYCDFGHKMLGRDYRECTAEGWDGDVPSCKPLNCSDPGEFLNGYYIAPNKTFGKNITFYCNIGYKMVGREYLQCTAEGWDGKVPSCESITCGNPGAIANGYYKAPNWTVGNDITFYCDIGYTIVGRDYRRCTAEGWDGEVPSCEPINCGDPGEILNGYYTTPNQTVGNTVTFYCDIGYKMVGRDYRQCTAEGWDGEVPSCELITCGNPGAITNGYYKASNWTIGNKVTFYCEIGYNIVGRDYRRCTAEGWDGEVPSCEPINCGDPGEILNGYYTLSNQTVGNKVNFYCDIGYKMVGRDNRQCTAEGWDGEVPSCQPITCGNPGEILNGYYKAPNKTVGNKVTFYCDFGHKMLGRDYRECTAEGWDGKVPSCKPLNCGDPGEILNGYNIAPIKTFGNKVIFYCDIGYKMVGRDYLQCTAEGWDDEVPSCEPITCGNPGAIANGYYKAPNWTVGNNVTFYCDIGYNIVGRDYRQCAAEGWDGEVPSCEPMNCDNPGEILNGYVTAPNQTVGNTVTFYCDIGYKMVGRDYRQCTAEGWDGEVPSCEPITCGNPGAVANGYYKAPNWTIGNKVTFYCDVGYNIVGRDYRRCTAEGWDGEVPSCEPMNCGNPGEILNGYFTAPNQTVENKVTFYCDIGYKMVGRDNRQCTAEGWDGEVPSCQPITCGNPGQILNGYYRAPNKTIGNKVTFYCDIGYKMLGRDYRECTAEGWHGEVPSCKPLNCGDPGEILNGYYIEPNKTFGSKVTFVCDIGYKMAGRDYRQCTAEGWDGEVLSCEPITCGNPGVIANGYYKAPNWTVGNKVTFYCDIGYNIVGMDYRRCTAEGWDGEIPSCERINCGNPGDILNGYYTAPNQTVGNKVTFHCDIGYKMVGRDYLRCTAGGWDGEVPSCEPITCGNPGEILNGYYKAPNKTVGNKVTFYCDIGYKMLGRDYRECTAEGWDGDFPSCKSINCGDPAAILNGYYITPNKTVGNKVIFYCDIGYKMVGNDYLQCTADGWDGKVPTCEPITCGYPGAIMNGYYKAPNWTVGNKVTFYCDIGYSIVGGNYRRCTAEGWDGEVPSCELINCGDPGEILNGYYTPSNQTVGNKVTFYCDIGYKMVGRDFWQCTTEGWDSEVPSCEPIACGNPGEILNGYYKAPNKTFGNKVTFYCDSGHKMVGRDYRQCTAEGWDGEVPSCEPTDCGNHGEILNGYYRASDLTDGNTVTFYCDSGYKMVGRDYLQCTPAGWDGEVPSCERTASSGLVQNVVGINLGIVALVGLVFFAVCCYRKRLLNKGRYYLDRGIPMTLQTNHTI